MPNQLAERSRSSLTRPGLGNRKYTRQRFISQARISLRRRHTLPRTNARYLASAQVRGSIMGLKLSPGAQWRACRGALVDKQGKEAPPWMMVPLRGTCSGFGWAARR